MIRDTLRSKWLYLLLALSIGVVFLAYQYAVPYSIDIGGMRADDELFIAGFHQRESSRYDSYRWTEGQASIAMPGIGRGRSWKLCLYLNGYRPPGELPPRVRLRVNGQELADFTAEQGMSEYQFRVDAPMIGWKGNLLLEIQPETFSPEGDSRELGVLVTETALVPAGGGLVIPPPLTSFLIAASVLILFLFLRWMGLSDKASVAASIPLPLALSVAVALERHQVTWYSFLVLALLGGAFLSASCLQIPLKHLARRWRWSSLQQDDLQPLLGILFLALALHLALSATPGFEGDITVYSIWAWKLTDSGIHTAYLPHDLWPAINYPPVIPYLLAVVGWLYHRFFAPTFLFPLEQSSVLLYSMIRLPTIMANVAIGASIFIFVRLRRDSRIALVASTSYLFNPAILASSAYAGQTDAIHSLFAVLAMIFLLRKRLAAAWMSIALAALTKPQGALFLPLVLSLTWRKFGLRPLLKGMFIASCVVLAAFSPFLYHGTVDSLLSYVLSISRLDVPVEPAYTTVGAHNIWWLLSSGTAVQDETAPLLLFPDWGQFITYRAIGLSLLAFFYALALFKLWKKADEHSVPMVAAFVGFACFMSMTQFHENYVFSVIPLLALVFLDNIRLKIIYSVLSITFLVNTILQDGGILSMLGLLTYEQLVASLGRLNAATNVGVLVYWTALLVLNWGLDRLSPIEPRLQGEAP